MLDLKVFILKDMQKMSVNWLILNEVIVRLVSMIPFGQYFNIYLE